MSAAVIAEDTNSMMDHEKSYSIKTEDGKLIFRTTSFTAEKSSVLHSGVYSREFTSILFASGICMAAYILLSNHISGTALYASLVVTLTTAFILSRTYIFRERYLEVAFDKKAGTASFVHSRTLGKSRDVISLSDIAAAETRHERFEPVNKDGADFVQKISVQHGSAVPGLGETEEFMILSLKLKNGTEKTIYAGSLQERPEAPIAEIRDFLSK